LPQIACHIRPIIHIKKLSHQLLREPDGFIFIPGLDALFAALPGKDQKLSRTIADQLLFFAFILIFWFVHLIPPQS
jgi:hypothetical protein